ncbi:MAG: glycosyltransferase family 4 protein [Prevotella sp.]|nr:glycosyltransferase family 4 protein [Prevotella sp.]
MTEKKYNIVYCTPSLYVAGGLERVLTLKANYFAEHYQYNITIILTDGLGKPFYYPVSDKIKIVNLDINFEELWTCSFYKKVILYLKKQRVFRRKLSRELIRIKPDITISLLRREINFITKIKDGSKKIGEIHVNRSNYRNFEESEANFFKKLFSRYWMNSLTAKLKKLDKFVVLTEEDRLQWHGLNNVIVIPDPLSFHPRSVSTLTTKRVIAVGRYVYQKGFDLLLRAWSKVEKCCPELELAIYGQGIREPYESLIDELKIERNRCHLYGPTADIESEYLNSSIFVLSSRFEGFGMVIVEAMACGLPVISFDCPCGPKDIITDGVNGFLIEKENVDELAKSIISLAESPDLANKIKYNAQIRSRDFDIDTVAGKWKSLFDSLSY